MKKAVWSTLVALGTTVGAFALYALTHPTVVASAMQTTLTISDREAKTNLRPVDTKQVLHRVARSPRSDRF